MRLMLLGQMADNAKILDTRRVELDLHPHFLGPEGRETARAMVEAGEEALDGMERVARQLLDDLGDRTATARKAARSPLVETLERRLDDDLASVMRLLVDEYGDADDATIAAQAMRLWRVRLIAAVGSVWEDARPLYAGRPQAAKALPVADDGVYAVMRDLIPGLPEPAAHADLLTVPEAAKLLEIARTTVNQAIIDGRLPATRRGGIYLIRRADVEAYAARRRPAPRRPDAR